MKKLLVLSGKGGTGKTTVSSALIYLFQAKSYADCDVDAPNLHLTMKQKLGPKVEEFYGMPKAVIDDNKCVSCGYCVRKCKFQALTMGTKVTINSFACEGCGLCAYICPEHAIEMKPYANGNTMVYEGDTYFSTAKLHMGAGASGKLVTAVKRNMAEVPEKESIAIIDGSPGIGCPVIASISGVDRVLLVTEPTVSGLSDLKRILQTVQHFGVPAEVCINKYDISEQHTEEIMRFCEQNNIAVIGKIPFDSVVSRCINEGINIVEVECGVSRELRKIRGELLNRMRDKL